MIHRRKALALLGGSAAWALAPTSARAQAAWRPSKNVTIVVPYPAGGPTDIIARIAARELQAAFGGPAVIVENQGGASGTIGTRRVAKAEADGHTLIVSTNQTHATNISLLKDGGGYDPVKDFTSLGGLADLQHVVVVRKDLEARNMAELIALAKKRTGEGKSLICASTGVGSAAHLTLELFKTRTGVDFVHVPYRGSAPLLQDLTAGQVDLSFATVPTVLGQVQGGALRALSVASPNPSPHLPDLATLAKDGISGVEADAWIGIFGPAGLPPAVVASIRTVLAASMAKPSVLEDIRKQGANPNWREPEAFAKFQREDVSRWAEIIKAAKVTVDQP